MRAEFFELLGHGDVIFQRILRPGFIEDVARVANGRLADGAGFENGVDRDAHVFDRVKRIENAENVDALGVGFADKLDNHIVRIRGVADGVRAAKQHLKTDIGNALAQLAKTLPRIFVKKAHGSVKGRAAPHFDAEQIRETLGDGAGGGQQIVRAHTRCHQ